jgi:hypothetical protein
MLGLAILVTIISMISAYYIAKQRHANQKFWVIMALLFGPLALPFMFFSNRTKDNDKDSLEM